MQLKQQDNQEIIIGGAKEMGFSIDTSSHVIFDILRSKMYSNKIGAVAREVASNSRDANRESGTGKPVQIEFTSNNIYNMGDTSIIFRDFGLGISPDRMENIFMKYAASTKRSDNSQTGGFGLGAKTPFAYTDSFIVRTVNEDIEYIYNAIIDQTGKGKMILLHEDFTDKEPGTEIVIPILSNSDREQFEKEVYRATLYWDNVEYINFQSQKPEIESIYQGKGFKIVKSIGWGSYVGLLDGIPYEIKPTYSSIINGHTVLFDLDVSEVTINANRESLQYDEPTQTYIDAKHTAFKKELTEKVEGYLKDNPTYKDAFQKYTRFSRYSTLTDSFEKFIHTIKSVNALGIDYGIYYKGDKIGKLSLSYHTMQKVTMLSNGKFKYDYGNFDMTLPLVYKDKGRISLAKNEALSNFMLITPVKDATPENIKTELDKLEEIGDPLLIYSEVKGVANPASKVKKDFILLKVRKGTNSYSGLEIKFDKVTKTFANNEKYAFIPVSYLKNSSTSYGTEDKIALVKHELKIDNVFFVNYETYIKHLRPSGYMTLDEAFAKVNLAKFAKYRDTKEIKEAIGNVHPIIMEHFPELLPKAYQSLTIPSLKPPVVLANVRWWNLNIPKSKFDYKGLENKYLKIMGSYYPMVLPYLRHSNDSVETKIKNVKNYVSTSNCNKR